MDKKGLEKELDYLLVAKNNVWTIFIATSGGSLGLLFAPNSIMKWALVTLGGLLSILFLDIYLRKDAIIESIIKRLKEGD
jgi:hypothetical protein